MHSLKEIQLKCNKQFIINFDGGELSSDGGLLMMKEFLHALGEAGTGQRRRPDEGDPPQHG